MEAKGGDDENTAVLNPGGMSYAAGFMFSNILLLGEEIAKDNDFEFELMLLHYTDNIAPSWQHLEGIDMYLKINYDI